MPRTIAEWIGKTPDTPAPPRVRRRVFDAYFGRCYLTNREIRPGDEWDLEHIRPLSEGGENRESNMAPALVEAHKKKTKKEAAVRKKVNRTRKKHIGIKEPPRGFWRPPGVTFNWKKQRYEREGRA